MRKLGKSLSVSDLGFGCMGLSHTYGASDDQEAIRTIHHALDRGVTLLDTADIYGNGHNEELVGRAIAGRRNQVVLATKFGNVLNSPDGGFDGSPAYAARACAASLKRLKVDVIDLWYVHRVDPNVPIEDTVGAMKREVEAGRVRFIGLSEAGAATLRRAQKIHPITALQTEYSLWTRDPEPSILPACRELGIGFVAYSPLGRGFLAGVHGATEGRDRRNAHPRFAPENVAVNRTKYVAVEAVAARHGIKPAQVALAWVLSRGADVVPIPGTRHIAHLDDNLAALAVSLTPADIAELEAAFAPGTIAGDRYPAGAMARLER
ncbi:MAG: aldo/keto reductase [Alphaproteobacteria bacterium]|nr:aldo/keto reductase [Alphaproteobacteria bacterium]